MKEVDGLMKFCVVGVKESFSFIFYVVRETVDE